MSDELKTLCEQAVKHGVVRDECLARGLEDAAVTNTLADIAPRLARALLDALDERDALAARVERLRAVVKAASYARDQLKAYREKPSGGAVFAGIKFAQQEVGNALEALEEGDR